MEIQDFDVSLSIYESIDKVTNGAISSFIFTCAQRNLEPKILGLTNVDGWRGPESILLHGADKSGSTVIAAIVPVQRQYSHIVWRLQLAEVVGMPTITDILRFPKPISVGN